MAVAVASQAYQLNSPNGYWPVIHSPSDAEYQCAVDVLKKIRATGGPITEDERVDFANCQDIIYRHKNSHARN